MSARLDAQAQALAAQRRLQAAVWRLDDVYFEHADDKIDAAEDALALAARDLTRAVDALPWRDQPEGWKRPALVEPVAEWDDDMYPPEVTKLAAAHPYTATGGQHDGYRWSCATCGVERSAIHGTEAECFYEHCRAISRLLAPADGDIEVPF